MSARPGDEQLSSVAGCGPRARGLLLVAALGIASAAIGGWPTASPTQARAALASPTPAETAGVDADRLETELQTLLERWVDDTPAIPGLLAYVAAPRLGLEWSGAAGVAERTSGEPLVPGAAFRIASNTKTFTAAAILRLAEDGNLDLDQPAGELLPIEYVDLLRAGGYDPDAILVRHLLLHTSGLYDYASDPTFLETVFADPAKRWTRLEQVRFAMEHGQPYGAPGETWSYSDTGYVLLGEIIERLTSKPLGASYRDLLDFARLGLTHTYLEREEVVPAGIPQQAHQYDGDLDATVMLDPSVDLYGGGGLVSTVEDLGRFYRALIRGEIFHNPATLETMLAIPPTNEKVGQAMGLFRLELGDQTCWGHGGYWGSGALNCPALDFTLAFSPNQAEPGDRFDDEFVDDVLEVVYGG